MAQDDPNDRDESPGADPVAADPTGEDAKPEDPAPPVASEQPEGE